MFFPELSSNKKKDQDFQTKNQEHIEEVEDVIENQFDVEDDNIIDRF